MSQPSSARGQSGLRVSVRSSSLISCGAPFTAGAKMADAAGWLRLRSACGGTMYEDAKTRGGALYSLGRDQVLRRRHSGPSNILTRFDATDCNGVPIAFRTSPCFASWGPVGNIL